MGASSTWSFLRSLTAYRTGARRGQQDMHSTRLMSSISASCLEPSPENIASVNMINGLSRASAQRSLATSAQLLKQLKDDKQGQHGKSFLFITYLGSLFASNRCCIAASPEQANSVQRLSCSQSAACVLPTTLASTVVVQPVVRHPEMLFLYSISCRADWYFAARVEHGQQTIFKRSSDLGGTRR